MSMLIMLKEGGKIVLEATGNTKLDEDLDLALNEAGSSLNFNLRWMLWNPQYKLQYSVSTDELLLVGV
tara:strand:- start:456 stop:659 length:204 start_codon:yes stop_codon:yes gene_type:complete